MSDCTVYIDESGDLGIGVGTQWFVLTAVIVLKQDEKNIRTTMEHIRTFVNVKEIHIRKIKEFSKRAYVTKALSGEKFVYMNVIVDTQKFDKEKIPSADIAYNYICKYLLQRVSWYLSANHLTCDVVLSARGTSRDGDLIRYIKEKLLPYPSNGINQELFNSITAKTSASWDLLQLADVCATTMFLAYEINGFGFCTPCYSLSLKDHLYRSNGRIESYGIKFFTENMKPDVEELRKHRICAK